MIVRTVHRKSLQGVLSLEVLITAVIASIVGIGVIMLLNIGSHEAMVSEDYMFAEALCQSILAENMAVSFNDLVKEKFPIVIPIGGVPKSDRVVAQIRPEYLMNLSGDLAFKGELVIDEVQKGLGLFSYEMYVEWPVSPRSKTMRKYILLRYRTRKDIAISTNFVIEIPKKE